MNEAPNQTVHDPVCHMDIEITSAAGRADYEGKTYYFCSAGCNREFVTNPAGVLEAEATYDHSQGSMMEAAIEHGGGPDKAPAEKPWWQFWR
jgi:YHS domain-containing protein